MFLLRSRQLCDQFAFGSQDHESDTEHGVGTGCKDGKFEVAVFYFELDFGTFAAADPVTLCFFQRVCPVDRLQSIQKPLCIGGYAQAPLTHDLLFHRIATTFGNAVHHFVVGQYRTQCGTPVYHRFASISDPVVQQDFLFFFIVFGFPFTGSEMQFFAASYIQTFRSGLFESGNQFADGTCLLFIVAVIAVEHLDECPLRPFIIFGIASTDLAVPVVTETYFVHLFPITGDVFLCRHFRMLSGLDSILFCRQSVGIVAHRMQNIETLQAFVTGINIRSDITEWVAYM